MPPRASNSIHRVKQEQTENVRPIPYRFVQLPTVLQHSVGGKHYSLTDEFSPFILTFQKYIVVFFYKTIIKQSV